MAATSGSNNNSTLVLDVENRFMETNKSLEVSRWEHHCIYRVPASFKDINSKAYHPQLVSLGPFHHGDPNLLPMEEHKLRAWRHVLRRAGRSAKEFTAAVEDVAEQLESAYKDLGDEWCAGEGRKKFLDMMVVDGCFMLEVVRVAAMDGVSDYARNDPIFSFHGILSMMPLIRRDMLMLENQLPLLLLQKLVAVELGNPPNDDSINRMVQRFVHPCSYRPMRPGNGLGLHPLDVFHRCMIGYFPMPRIGLDPPDNAVTRSAVELNEAGIRFKASSSSCLGHVRFRRGVLSMPPVSVDDSTVYSFRNMMAFELLHVGADKRVTEYVYFMDCIIQSAKDVALLMSKGIIIQNGVGGHEAVAKMFNSLARDLLLEQDGAVLALLLRQLNAYSRLPWEMWFTYLRKTYFRSPWAFMSLAAAFFLILMTGLQTVYTMLQFYRDG